MIRKYRIPFFTIITEIKLCEIQIFGINEIINKNCNLNNRGEFKKYMNLS